MHEDAKCDEARSLPESTDVPMPTGGFFQFFMSDGKMWIDNIGQTVRQSLREQAALEWGRLDKHRTQGLLARLVKSREVYQPGLDLIRYTHIFIYIYTKNIEMVTSVLR